MLVSVPAGLISAPGVPGGSVVGGGATVTDLSPEALELLVVLSSPEGPLRTATTRYANSPPAVPEVDESVNAGRPEAGWWMSPPTRLKLPPPSLRDTW